MKHAKHTFVGLFMVLNALVGGGLLVGAYGQYLSPATYPLLSLSGLGFSVFVFLNFLFLLFWLFVKQRNVWLPILLFLASGDALLTFHPMSFSKSPKDGEVLKVLTYNTAGMQDKIVKGKKPTNPVADYILQSKADIVCLQEFPISNTTLIQKLKKQYPYLRTVTFRGTNSVACLSKYPVVSGKSLNLISPYNGAGIFQIKYKNHTLPIIVNHLESNKLSGDEREIYESMVESPKSHFTKSGGKHLLFKLADAATIRAPQAKQEADVIQKLNSPYILVCGDFNDVPLSYTRRVIGKGLQDAYRKTNFGPGITYNSHLMYFRIDHILAGKGYRVLDCKIDTSIEASDHYPMWCQLEI